ncbi:PAS domain S-box protein [Chamaesiphon minutus]|uniref:histidine kinase n=1 Tax=Chamaesiphon minutus (strain ATCC 27169 / PCC 6605) TaxID=1173020 RepID=K9UD60_CHAP6|nr:PAS domain S-box protein [Chamaesiphon minutus]AFY92351.1 PAS domain S-box [Chamaesiphon minutus PCC 6605]
MHIPTFTLLIVEDFAPDRELYRRALSQDSRCVYQLLEAESVEAGLALCRSNIVDAILLDYALPDGDGLAFLAALDNQSNGSSPPVVMLTGVGNQGVAVRAMKLGAEDYLVKCDLTPQLLQSTIRSAIENTRLRLQLQQSQEQAELTLQAKNQQITTIWESMTDAYVTLDRQWRVVYTNLAATEIYRQTTGLTPAEYLGKSYWEVFPATVGTIVEQEYRRAVTDRVAVHFEVLYEPTDTWLEIHAYPSEIGLGLYFRDINQRKQNKAARLQAERERDRFFDLSLELLGVVNLDGYFVRINPACEQILGFTSAEIMAQPYLDFLHPDDIAASMAVLESLSAGNVLVNFENRYRRKDGSYCWILWSAILEPEHNLVYASGRDITERKRDEELLRQSEELTRRILESNRDCIKVLDLAGRLIYMNDYGQSLMEIDDFNTVARSQWLEFWQGSERELAQTAFSKALAGGVDRFDGYCATAKGTPKWWEVIVTPILAADGQVSQILSVSRDITERKQLEAQLRQRESQLQLFVKYVPVGVAMFDRDMCYLSASDVWLDCHELRDSRTERLRQRDIVGRSHYDLYPNLPQEWKERHQRCLAGAIESCEEDLFPRPDGAIDWVRWEARPWYTDTDEVGGIIMFSEIITERKLQSAALLQSERKFSAIFNQTFQLMGLVNLDGVVLDVNQAALDSIAASESEIVGKSFWDAPWWHTEQLQQQLKAAIATSASGQFVRYEVEFPNPNGGVTITDFSLKPMFDEVGRVESIVAEAHDISDRKHVERELKESEERLQTGIEVAGVGLARFDYATNLVALSPEAAALYGFAPNQLVVTREQIHDTFHPDERAELEEIIAQVIDPAGTGWFARDHRVMWPTGEVRCLSVRKQVVFDRSGAVARPSYAILAAIDITDRRQAQADLEQRNQELDSFVYVVSHDLKAPLRGIANLSEWIEDDLEGSLSVANQEQMTLLRSRVYKMQATIDGLLDYARIGQLDETIESVAVAKLLVDVIDSIAPPPTFTIELPPALPMLSTRRLPLFQVLANLIGNGIKHHDRVDGSIQVSIEDRGDCYEFAIADDGPGIAPEHHDRMFKIFQAVNPQNRSDSTGIGLAIVKKIVEAEGGTIWLESELDRGTTFYFTWLKC